MTGLWLALALAACRTDSGADDPRPIERRLTLAAYTTPREAYRQAVLPAFAAQWKRQTGETVAFEESYQPSGAAARAVTEGLEADVVALALATDLEAVQRAGLITHDWESGPTNGIVTTTLAVIAVRPGNPKQIGNWSDLARESVDVVAPNARTSGGARWGVLAVYGSAIRGHTGFAAGDSARAEALLADVFGRVVVMDKGARESLVTFETGVGDAAITYENEVLVARAEGVAMDYVVPSSTILIENPMAVVDTYARKHGNEELAAAFVAFCQSPEAAALYARFGLRPAAPGDAVGGLPRPPDLFTVRDLGGWPVVTQTLFEKGALVDRALARVQRERGN